MRCDFKVMTNLAGQYILTATVVDGLGREGFWFSDYACESVAKALCSPDRLWVTWY